MGEMMGSLMVFVLGATVGGNIALWLVRKELIQAQVDMREVRKAIERARERLNDEDNPG